jgi:hypothetical protein
MCLLGSFRQTQLGENEFMDKRNETIVKNVERTWKEHQI